MAIISKIANPHVSAQLKNNLNDSHYIIEDKNGTETSAERKLTIARAEDILTKNIEWVNGGLRPSKHVAPVITGDLGEILRNYKHFLERLPNVDVHYAVKANSEPMIVKLLINTGSSFDCASISEVKLVTSLGANPDKIIFAHPRCNHEQLVEAWDLGVRYAVFDSLQDLDNAKTYYPDMKFLIRIVTDDSGSKVPLGKKFGTPTKDVPALLDEAKKRNLDVVGVAFHVGSDSHDARAFAAAIETAHAVFDEGVKHGFRFSILDLGGGYTQAAFDGMASVICRALDKHFPDRNTHNKIRVIAEPGRYLVSSAFVLGARVIGVRDQVIHQYESGMDHVNFMIDLSDGVYGALANTVSDGQERIPVILSKLDPSNKWVKYSMIWGPTCDSFDKLGPFELPGKLHYGDWVYFEDMGAYTIPCATEFNGNAKARIIWTTTEDDVYGLLDLTWKLRLCRSNYISLWALITFGVTTLVKELFGLLLNVFGRSAKPAIALD